MAEKTRRIQEGRDSAGGLEFDGQLQGNGIGLHIVIIEFRSQKFQGQVGAVENTPVGHGPVLFFGQERCTAVI